MRVRWPWQRWRRYDLSVDGRHFRAWVNPVHREVEWLDCPDDTTPSGYSSSAAVAGTRCRASRWWHRWHLPIPTYEEMKCEIREWLHDLDPTVG